MSSTTHADESARDELPNWNILSGTTTPIYVRPSHTANGLAFRFFKSIPDHPPPPPPSQPRRLLSRTKIFWCSFLRQGCSIGLICGRNRILSEMFGMYCARPVCSPPALTKIWTGYARRSYNCKSWLSWNETRAELTGCLLNIISIVDPALHCYHRWNYAEHR